MSNDKSKATLNKVRLGDITSIASGSGFPTNYQGSSDAQFPFYKVSDMNLPGNEIYMTFSNNTISEDVRQILKAQPHPKSTIIFPKIGAAIATNKKRLLTRPSCFDNNVIGILPCKACDPLYLFHLLLQTDISQFANTGNPPSIRKTTIEDWQIPLPPLAEQKRIAGILDAADALRAKRREALAQLDTLLQSTFLDMFGDPVTNPKGWDVRQLKESGVEVKVGPFGSLLHKADYIPGGIPLINPKHIVDGSIEHSGDESVSTSKANELQEYLLKEGDVLLARRGEMGRCVIIRAAHENWLCGTGSVIVRVTSNLYDPEFLAAAFGSQQMRKHLENLSGGAIMPSLSGTQIKTLPLLVPPRSKQNEFSLFIKLLKAQKFRMQSHLAELDALFASLQSRAFNGEL